MGLSKFLPYRQVHFFGYALHYVTLRKRILKEAEHWHCRKVKGGYLFALNDAEAEKYFVDSSCSSCSQAGEWRLVKMEKEEGSCSLR